METNKIIVALLIIIIIILLYFGIRYYYSPIIIQRLTTITKINTITINSKLDEIPSLTSLLGPTGLELAITGAGTGLGPGAVSITGPGTVVSPEDIAVIKNRAKEIFDLTVIESLNNQAYTEIYDIQDPPDKVELKNKFYLDSDLLLTVPSTDSLHNYSIYLMTFNPLVFTVMSDQNGIPLWISSNGKFIHVVRMDNYYGWEKPFTLDINSLQSIPLRKNYAMYASNKKSNATFYIPEWSQDLGIKTGKYNNYSFIVDTYNNRKVVDITNNDNKEIDLLITPIVVKSIK